MVGYARLSFIKARDPVVVVVVKVCKTCDVCVCRTQYCVCQKQAVVYVCVVRGGCGGGNDAKNIENHQKWRWGGGGGGGGGYQKYIHKKGGKTKGSGSHAREGPGCQGELLIKGGGGGWGVN